MSIEHRHILTTRGGLWNLHEPGFRNYLGYFGSDDEIARRAVFQLGFIYVRRLDDRIRIYLRPDSFPWLAFEALVYELSRHQAVRIALEFATVENLEPPGLIAQLFNNFEDAIAYLDALRSCSPDEIERPKFFATELDLRRLPSQNRQQLRLLYRNWALARGRLGEHRLRRMREDPLNAPMLLTRRNSKGFFVAETWPNYLTLVPADKVSDVIGSPIDQLPYSGAYAAEAAAGFREVTRRLSPILELVEAVVHFQSAPSRRVRYERLSLPWRGPGGEEFASSYSIFRSKRVVGS